VKDIDGHYDEHFLIRGLIYGAVIAGMAWWFGYLLATQSIIGWM
jgi:hypothetical protein